MGFTVTKESEKVRQGNFDQHPKNRVWGNFETPNETRLENRRHPLKTQQEKPTYTYKIASGRTFWPSRDPIGEDGGLNVYDFGMNVAPVNGYDYLGREFDPTNDVDDTCFSTAGIPSDSKGAQARALAHKLKKELNGSCLAKASNILEVVDKLTGMITNGDITANIHSDEDVYTTLFSHLNSKGSGNGVLHELVHAWVHKHTDVDDDIGYNMGDDRRNEGMAYGMGVLYDFFVSLSQNETNSDIDFNCGQYAMRLHNRFTAGIRRLESFDGKLNDGRKYWGIPASSFVGDKNDIKRLAKMLGLKFDCKKYLKCLQSAGPKCSCEVFNSPGALDNACPKWLDDLK